MTVSGEATLFAAIRAGARGYLLKGSEGEETLRAIRAVSSGEAIFSPNIAERLMQHFANESKTGTALPFPDLTPANGKCCSSSPRE